MNRIIKAFKKIEVEELILFIPLFTITLTLLYSTLFLGAIASILIGALCGWLLVAEVLLLVGNNEAVDVWCEAFNIIPELKALYNF